MCPLSAEVTMSGTDLPRDGIPGLRAAWSPLSITAWHRTADRQMDRETDRRLCMALRAPQGRGTDGQTDHSASLCRHHLGDRWTDRAGVSERPDRQTDSRSLSSVLPASHRLPTGSILWKMLPPGAEVGRHPPPDVWVPLALPPWDS